jgi:hypothetical protein
LPAARPGNHIVPARRWRRIGRESIPILDLVIWKHNNTAFAINWESGNPSSVYRTCWFYRIEECIYGLKFTGSNHSWNPNTPNFNGTISCQPAANMSQPLGLMSGSGRFYNYYDDYVDGLHTKPSYRHLLIDGGSDLHFYQLNLEHASGVANLEIANSENVYIYGFKTEPAGVGIWIRDSKNINAYSFGGNGYGPDPRTYHYPCFTKTGSGQT